MRAMEELYVVVRKQKSIRVRRLGKLLRQIAEQIDYKNKRINSQKDTIEKLNKQCNHQRNKINKLQKQLDAYKAKEETGHERIEE